MSSLCCRDWSQTCGLKGSSYSAFRVTENTGANYYTWLRNSKLWVMYFKIDLGQSGNGNVGNDYRVGLRIMKTSIMILAAWNGY